MKGTGILEIQIYLNKMDLGELDGEGDICDMQIFLDSVLKALIEKRPTAGITNVSVINLSTEAEEPAPASPPIEQTFSGEAAPKKGAEGEDIEQYDAPQSTPMSEPPRLEEEAKVTVAQTKFSPPQAVEPAYFPLPEETPLDEEIAAYDAREAEQEENWDAYYAYASDECDSVEAEAEAEPELLPEPKLDEEDMIVMFGLNPDDDVFYEEESYY